jgi:hypothetical protein
MVVWNGRKEHGSLVDVSRIGARLITFEQIPIGGSGTLSLGHGGSAASASFEVRSLHPDGSLGVLFDQAGVSPSFAAAMQRLASTANERAA